MHCTAVDIGYMMVITIGDKVQYICGSYDGSLIEEAYSWADENLQILSLNTAILVKISTRITEFSPRNL